MYRPQLKTFLTVCDTHSFSAAAAALYLTPSAVQQQMTALEGELGAPLFQRSSKGVTLTAAGECLQRRGRSMVQLSEETRREIRELAAVGRRIRIGSSMMEKVRLLYDLWMLFAERERDCEIQMLSIDALHNIPPETDLIESVHSNVPWMRRWEFFEICRVPMGFAVVKDHPLAGMPVLRPEDLRHYTVLTLDNGSCDTLASLLELLRRNYVPVLQTQQDGSMALWESAFRRDVLLVPFCWQDILINMTVIPFSHTFSLPYGVFYRHDPNPAVRRFLDFIMATYREGNERGIVPVL